MQAAAALLTILIGCAPLPQDPLRGQTIDDQQLVDEDFAFAIARVEPSWQLLSEREVRAVGAAAQGGAKLPDGRWLAVIAEPLPDGLREDEPDALAELVLEGLEIGAREVLERRAIDFKGAPAVRLVVRGQQQGRAFTWVWTVLARADYAYQVLAWAEGEREPADLCALHDAVTLLERRPRARAAPADVADRHGNGWRVVSGRFESAACGLVVTPPPGWRLLVGDELAEVNADAEVGLCNDAETCVVVVVEYAGRDADRLRALARAGLREAIEAHRELEPIVLRVAGEDRAFEVLESESLQLDFLHAAIERGSQLVQIQAHHRSARREAARAEVREALAALRFAGGEEASAMREALRALPDADNEVGAEHALRNGRWVDFAHRCSWRKPSGVWWRAVAGDSAAAEMPGALLFVEAPEIGLYAFATGSSADHATACAQIAAGLDAAEIAAAEELGGLPVSTIAGRADGLALGYRLLSAVRDGADAVHMVVYGIEDAMREFAPQAQACLQALRLDDELAATQRTAGAFVDHRLGLTVALGTVFDTITDETPPALADRGTLLSAATGPGAMLVLAACGEAREAFEERLDALARERFASFVAGAARGDDGARLAGLSAERWRWFGSRTVEVLIAQRARTLYGVVLAGDDAERERMLLQFGLVE
jgi:hypothetical protein